MTRRSVTRESIKDVIPDTTTMASSDLFGITIDLRSTRDGLLLIPIDLQSQLLDLPFLRSLELLLVFYKLIYCSFLLAVRIYLGFEGAFNVLFIDGI